MNKEEFIYVILVVFLALIVVAIIVPFSLWLEEKKANIYAKSYNEVIVNSIKKLDKE